MAKIAIVKASTMALAGRLDAKFGIKLTEMLRARGIPEELTEAMYAGVRELKDRGEFPTGIAPRPAPKHVECPNCMSWEVDSDELTRVKTIEAIVHTEYSAVYDCRQCHNVWGTESGFNSQPN